MIPHAGRAIDTVNFRNVKESASSMDIGSTPTKTTTNGSTDKNSNTGGAVNGLDGNSSSGGKSASRKGSASALSKSAKSKMNISGDGGFGGQQEGGAGGKEKELVIPTAGLKGVPLDSGEKTPMGEQDMVDPFEEFNSVTLHHEGDADDQR